MSLLFEIEFGSFLVYSPKGTEPVSKNSRAIRDSIKNNGTLKLRGETIRTIPYLSAELNKRIPGTVLEPWFAGKPLLVPAPRSSLMVPNSLYPTKLICDSMVASGLASETRLLLERTRAVPKAAFSKPEDRPTVQQHFDSLRVNVDLDSPREIIVVDDFVTRGTMFLASVSRLQMAYPHATVRAFAFVRTMSGQEVANVVEMCTGSVYRRDDWGTRRP